MLDGALEVPDNAKPEAPAGSLFSLGLRGFPAVIANLSAVGVLCWFLWHLVVKDIPQLQQNFHEELKAERTLYREELKAAREHDMAETVKLIGAIGENQRSISEVQKTIGETQRILGELAVEIRRVKIGAGGRP